MAVITVCDGLHFQIDNKINHDNLDLLDKSITFGGCMFSPANLHSVESLHIVPPYIVPESARIIANLNNQSTIFMLDKIDQDQPMNPDKLMLFFHVSK